MNALIPADPGTQLISHDPGVWARPILGWTLHHAKLVPVMPGRSGAIVTGEAFYFPGRDLVMDASTGRMFHSESDWRQWVEDESPYTLDMVIPGLCLNAAPGADAPLPTKVSTASGIKMPIAASAASIRFNGKVYEKGTFWKLALDGENFIAIMAVSGKTASPIGPGVVRVTRNEFSELRQTLTVVEPRDDLMDQLRAIGAPDPAPEVQRDEAPEPVEADDDDADGLI